VIATWKAAYVELFCPKGITRDSANRSLDYPTYAKNTYEKRRKEVRIPQVDVGDKGGPEAVKF